MPNDEATVFTQLRQFDNGKLSSKQVKELADSLAPNETIVDAISGHGNASGGGRKDGEVLLAITNLRAIVLIEFGFFGTEVRSGDLYWQDVERIALDVKERRVEIMHYSVNVFFAKFDKSHPSKERVEEFGRDLQRRLAALKSGVRSIGSAGEARSEESLLDQLERLAALKEKGAISDEEFQQAKERLL